MNYTKAYSIVCSENLAPSAGNNGYFRIECNNRPYLLKTILIDLRLVNINAPFDRLDPFGNTVFNWLIELGSYNSGSTPVFNQMLPIAGGTPLLGRGDGQLFVFSSPGIWHFNKLPVTTDIDFRVNYANFDAAKTFSMTLGLLVEIEYIDSLDIIK